MTDARKLDKELKEYPNGIQGQGRRLRMEYYFSIVTIIASTERTIAIMDNTLLCFAESKFAYI